MCGDDEVAIQEHQGEIDQGQGTLEQGSLETAGSGQGQSACHLPQVLPGGALRWSGWTQGDLVELVGT